MRYCTIAVLLTALLACGDALRGDEVLHRFAGHQPAGRVGVAGVDFAHLLHCAVEDGGFESMIRAVERQIFAHHRHADHTDVRSRCHD